MPQSASAPPARRSRWLWLALAGVILLAAAVYAPKLWERRQERQLSRMALPELETRARQQPADLKARYRLGLAYARDNRYREAVGEFMAVLEKDPVRPDVLNDLGVVYLLQDRYYEALVALQGALTARPNYAPAYANLGRLHLATKMPFTAVRELEKSVELDPQSVDTLCDLGEAYQRTLNLKSARDTYERALKIKPDHVAARIGLGRSLYSLAQYDAAEQTLNDALRLTPENPVILQTLGRIRLEKSRTDADLIAAKELFQRAVKADPQEGEAWYDLGRVNLRLKQPGAAVEDLRRALQLDPQHTGTMHQLERALRAVGRISEADRVAKVHKERALREREELRLEEALARSPKDWDSAARLAELYIQSGKQGLAALTVRNLQEGAADHPKLPALTEAMRRQGMSLAGAGGASSR